MLLDEDVHLVKGLGEMLFFLMEEGKSKACLEMVGYDGEQLLVVESREGIAV
jgi:hypothetical protein